MVTTIAGQYEQAGALNGNTNEATFNNPHDVAVAADGTVFIADRWNHLIRKISTTGAVTTLAGTAGISGDIDDIGTAASFNEPWSICLDTNGDLLVADTKNNKIRKITSDGTVTTIAGTGNFGANDGNAGNATFANPSGIAVDEQGNIYVADHQTHIIRKISTDNMVTTIAGIPYTPGNTDGLGNAASFNRPYGITIDNDNNIIIADEWNHKIRRLSPDGQVTTIAGAGEPGNRDGAAEEATFNFPWDVAVDHLGNILVADGLNYQIRKITTEDEVYTFAGLADVTGGEDGFGFDARFAGVTGIAFSPYSMDYYLTDAYNHLVRKLTDFEIGNRLRPEGFIATNDNNIFSYCAEQAVVLNAIPFGFDNYSFFVDNELAQNGVSPELILKNLPQGNYTIDVVSSRVGQSHTSMPVAITILPPNHTTINVVGETTFYLGDSVLLVAPASSDYFWSTGATTATLTVLEAGDYFVETIDNNDCPTISDTVSVTTLELPPIPIILDIDGNPILATEITTCGEESFFLFSEDTSGVQWIRDDWPLEGETKNYVRATEGEYKLSVTTDGITQTSAPLVVQKKPFPNFEIKVSDREVLPETPIVFELVSEEELTCLWSFGDSLSNTIEGKIVEYTYNETGLYTIQLELTAADNCTKVVEEKDFIIVTNLPDQIFIPSAFSPNSDGINDFLGIKGNVTDIDFKVFNQWGQLVFRADDASMLWDGNINGEPTSVGNYVYTVAYLDFSGRRKHKTGNVALIR